MWDPSVHTTCRERRCWRSKVSLSAIAWIANSWFLPTDAAWTLRTTIWGGALLLLSAYAWLSWYRRTWQPWCLPMAARPYPRRMAPVTPVNWTDAQVTAAKVGKL